MTYKSKQKRSSHPEHPYSQRDFYWELFRTLFIPISFVAGIFLLGAFSINQRDSASIQRCTTENEDSSVRVRVIADVDQVRYEASFEQGGWQPIMDLSSFRFPYDNPCNQVQIRDSVIVVAHPLSLMQIQGAVVKTQQRIERFELSNCGELDAFTINNVTDETITVQFDCDTQRIMEFNR